MLTVVYFCLQIAARMGSAPQTSEASSIPAYGVPYQEMAGKGNSTVFLFLLLLFMYKNI
jgi:hypothetical protein